jgi:hypothetical protein
VLFALAALTGRLTLAGGYGYRAHPAYPNCTVPIMGQTPKALSFMRNLIWSEKTGTWDLAQLTVDQGLFGPHARQYHGHNKYWYGSGTNFKAKMVYGKKKLHTSGHAVSYTLYKFTDSIRKRHGWAIVDFMHGTLLAGYNLATELSNRSLLTVDIKPLAEAAPRAIHTNLAQVCENDEGRLW